MPVEARVWRRVRDLATTFGSGAEPAKEIPLTQELIAQLTGCAPPTANRAARRRGRRGHPGFAGPYRNR